VARADGVMTGAYSMAEALRRVRAFDAAGADCLYVPLPPDMAALAAVCRATAKPVNALAAGAFSAVPRAGFAEIGVARISLGSALARVTHAALIEAARDVLEGDFARLGAGAKGVDALLAQGAQSRH
jgi:2-methylisocitrate lyase-like PEP mutase family enzyme